MYEKHLSNHTRICCISASREGERDITSDDENYGFRDLQNRIFELHRERRPREALELLENATQLFPRQSKDILYWRACFRSLLGEPDSALNDLNEAMRLGGWWSRDDLLNDHDLKAIRSRREFQEILDNCNEMKVKAQAAARPELLVLAPKNSKGSLPVLFTLHGRGVNAEATSGHWKSVVSSNNVILAVPQSSQVYSKDRFSWDDPALAKTEILDAFLKVTKSYDVDSDKVILGGFSQGGALAVQFALDGTVPCRAFVVVAPAFRETKAIVPLVEKATSEVRRIRG